jgi:hypothetical protein
MQHYQHLRFSLSSRLFAWYRLRVIGVVLSPQLGNKRVGELERRLLHLQLSALPHTLLVVLINIQCVSWGYGSNASQKQIKRK